MKSKLHIIANIDNSIKANGGIYEISLFRNFMDWSIMIDKNPTLINLMIITEDVVPFTASNMDALFRHLDSSFFTLQDKVIYCVRSEELKLKITEYLILKERNDKVQVVRNTCDFQGILSIINGSGRNANENEKHTITYRVRADEYAKAQAAKKYQTSDEDHYAMDDEEFPEDSDFTFMEPDIPQAYEHLKLVSLSGEKNVRAYFGIVLAQYLSLFGKTLIIERDLEFHTTTNALASIGVPFEFVDYSQFVHNATAAINQIKNTSQKLVLIGCTQRTPALSYDFLMMLCLSKLKGFVEYLISESDLNTLSSGTGGIIVMENTIPHILETTSAIPSGVDCSKFQYVVVSTLVNGALSRPHQMIKDLLTDILGTEVNVESYALNGLVLSEGGLNDLQVLFRGDRGGQVIKLHTSTHNG